MFSSFLFTHKIEEKNEKIAKLKIVPSAKLEIGNRNLAKTKIVNSAVH